MWKQSNHRMIVSFLKKDLSAVHNITNTETIVRKMSISKCFYKTLFNPVNSKTKLLCVAQPYLKNVTLQKYSEAKTSANTVLLNKLKDITAIRTQESDPRNHDERHLGRIYTMPGKYNVLFILSMLRYQNKNSKEYLILFHTFGSFLDEVAKALGAAKDKAPHCMVPVKLLELQQLFGEYSFLIRQPALEVISYLKQVKNLETKNPVNNVRFVLWGEHGTGKSTR